LKLEVGITGKPSGAGKRVIMIGIGSEDEFMSASKCFIGKSKTNYYHNEMNGNNFKEWFAEVLDAVPQKSVLVFDQASYHKMKTFESRNPSTLWRKRDVIEWLTKQNVSVPDGFSSFEKMTLLLLRALAKEKKIPEVYVIEEMADNGCRSKR